MLINIDQNTGEVTKLDTTEKDKLLDICCRLYEELGDWVKYKHMTSTGDTRYTAIAAQEFQHALVAMSDLLDALKSRVSPEELIQLNKFRSDCLS